MPVEAPSGSGFLQRSSTWTSSSLDLKLIKLSVFPWHYSGINSWLPVPSILGSGMCQGIFFQTPEGVNCPAYLLSSFPVSHLSERFSRNYSAPQRCDRRELVNILTNCPYLPSSLASSPSSRCSGLLNKPPSPHLTLC